MLNAWLFVLQFVRSGLRTLSCRPVVQVKDVYVSQGGIQLYVCGYYHKSGLIINGYRRDLITYVLCILASVEVD
ncbi:hypothetical protein F4678DRAFT_437441 [Xylaria arbuscula]|nr:hypothetical protein F4678DRAFT_437441 [Xylaria arbuscula]